MSIFAVNSNNDMFAVNGRLQMKTGVDAVLQNCEHAVKALRGEMIYAANRGMNTFTSVWSGSPNVLSFESSVRTVLSRVAGVIGVSDLTTRISGDTLEYRATIRTTFGIGTINGQL